MVGRTTGVSDEINADIHGSWSESSCLSVSEALRLIRYYLANGLSHHSMTGMDVWVAFTQFSPFEEF